MKPLTKYQIIKLRKMRDELLLSAENMENEAEEIIRLLVLDAHKKRKKNKRK